MLTKPKHGWVDVELGDFSDRASYLTDIPHDCLDAFTQALKNNEPVVIYFDAEGWDYHLVSSYYDSYIILDKDSLQVFRIEKNYKDLAKELIEDIEKYIDDWADWMCYRDFNDSEFEQNKRSLESKLVDLKMLIRS